MEKDLFLERAAACALNRIFGYEPRYGVELICNLGSAAAVFRLSSEELDSLFGPYGKYRKEINADALEKASRELERIEASGCHFLSYCEEEYPSLLRECPDAPAGLYWRGTDSAGGIFGNGKKISMVGTRDISLYGKEWCPRIVGALASARIKPAVVSGLAIGVDIESHLAALAYGLPTIAVIPTGIDDIYPKRHGIAATKIASAPGSAIVTDFPPGTSPVAYNFLRRNRIIAGMSSATILVESRKQGGGTMTARLASQYGRDVFALPGRIEDSRSEGCNLLLREKIAEALTSLEVLPGQLGLGELSMRRRDDILELAERKYRELNEQSLSEIKILLSLIKGHRGVDAENAASQTNISFQRVMSLLELLEADEFIDIDLLGRCSIHRKNL